MEIVVFGAGSLGSLIGGLLARDHAVTLIGRRRHVRAITDDGLHLGGAIDRTVEVAARTELAAGADLALVTVKAYDTAGAADALAPYRFGAVLSLQNGLGNEERLADRLDTTVLAGTTTYGATLRAPGDVECTGEGTIRLGPLPPSREPAVDRARRVGDAFASAGIETDVVADMRRPLWRKLATNAAVNPVTALADVRNGRLVGDPAGPIAARAATETAAVARDRGIDLTDTAVRAALSAVLETTATNSSSMRQDFHAGRRTEIDAINGAVVDRAGRPVPVNETLTALVRAWEAGRDRR